MEKPRFKMVARQMDAGRQGGWAIMEVLIAIVISLTLAAGAASMYSSGDRLAYQENVRSSLVDLRAGLHNAFLTRSDYSGLDISTAESLGVIPTIFSSRTGPGNSRLDISAGPDGTFEIIFSDFESKEDARHWCLQLLPNPRGDWVATAADSSFGENLLFADVADDCENVSSLAFRGR